MASATSTPTPTERTDRFDAIIIGAGIAGMYQLYKLRQQGLRVRVYETGTDVGGTWYWNRYPGARFDSESYTYGYSFSDELLQEWNWSEHFSPQPETLRYLQHVADKFDLRRDIQFSTRVSAAHWNDDEGCWEIATEAGERARAKYLITAPSGNSRRPSSPLLRASRVSRANGTTPRSGPKRPLTLPANASA